MVDDVVPEVEVRGSGPTKVLALHGWLGTSTSWNPVLAHLDLSASTYALLDCRGYGRRLEVEGDHTMSEIVGDALAAADELGWSTFSVLGHSMGGMAMQKVVVEAPERVERLIGISPVPASGVPFDDDAWGLFSAAPHEPSHRRTIIDMTTGNRLTSVWLDAMVAHSRAHSTPAAMASYLEEWARSDFHEEVTGRALPVKVVVGEHDPAISAEVVRQTFVQWYPDCELEVIGNAGHYAMDETPVALATSIDRFLSR